MLERLVIRQEWFNRFQLKCSASVTHPIHLLAMILISYHHIVFSYNGDQSCFCLLQVKRFSDATSWVGLVVEPGLLSFGVASWPPIVVQKLGCLRGDFDCS